MESSGNARVPPTQDAMVTDFSEKGRPPDTPPDGAGSWAKVVTGTSVGGRMVPELMLNEEFVMSRLSVEFPNGEEGEPEITIGKDVLEAMNGLWKRCMIVKVLGRNIPIAVLTKKLRELWRPKGEMYVMDLPRQFFIVRFGEEEEYLAALTGGPWRAFGSYLMVQAWSPEFDPTKDAIVTTPVWVRISNLPINLYHKTILMGIAKGLGKPLRVDDTTLNLERARFARVCIEIDLRKPLKGSVLINKERYYVAYEGLNNICSGCGIYGHMVQKCPKGAGLQTVNATPNNFNVTGRTDTQVNDGFTVVRKHGRRAQGPAAKLVFSAGGSGENPGRNLREISTFKESENIALMNKFGSLNDDLIEPEIREEALITEEIKENKIVHFQRNNGKNIMEGSEKGFVGHVVKGKSGAKANSNDKRGGPNKSVMLSGPRTKYQNKPTRGLVLAKQIIMSRFLPLENDYGWRERILVGQEEWLVRV